MGQNLQPAVEPGSMKMHGTFVRKCCGSLWAESPILRNLASCALPEIKCDEDTWNQLEIVLQGGPFPTDYRDLFKLLTVTVELQLKKWTRRTLKELFSTPDYWQYQVPADTPDEIVLLCFRQPLNRLFRTDAVHRRQVDEILSLPDGPRLRASLTEELNSTIEKFMKLDLDRVPCDFKLRCAPMLIMKRKGEFKTAFCNCDQRSCVPFELFGKFFDPSRVDIDAFHLKYASYLLYKSGEKVYFRNIKCEAKAAPYLDRCKLLISKYDKVLAVTEEKSRCHIRIWNENEAENGGSFADIHSTTDAIANVDIGSSEVFLILKEDGSLLVAERGNTNLVITLLGEEYSSAWFHDGVLYGFFLDEDEGEDHRIHRFKRVSAGQWKKEREYSNRRSLEEFAKGRRITSIGGELFRVSENGFEMYSASGWPTMILSSEEYVASSELYLHP